MRNALKNNHEALEENEDFRFEFNIFILLYELHVLHGKNAISQYPMISDPLYRLSNIP